MARKFDPGRVAQHGFEYQKFVYYYLISSFKTKYDKYYYEGKEDIHFESSKSEEKLKLFVQVKTANLALKEKKKILIKWLSIGEIADKYILFCEKNNDYDISLIADDVIEIIKNAKEDSDLSNANIAYKKYISNGGFDEIKLRSDIKLIKDNLSKMDIKSVETMFSELRGQMKEEAENDSVIDSTLESRIYYILTKILSKIHNEYVDDMNSAVEITYNEYMNYYIEARNTYPCKKLKHRRDFKTRSEYCLYLRKRLLVKNTNTEFADGGLLIASHILSNKILNNNFKNYIYRKVEKISIQMTKDIEKIGFDDVCQDLEMSRINNKFGCNDYHYICEKFHDYLYHEAKNEIENNIFYDFHVSFRNESHNTNYSNAEWSIRLLNKLHNFYTKEDLINAKTFADMYEITLQRIWFYLNEQEERL